ncbi:hypothetical protein PEBR_07820 [Penicillium brasilianum]|uniref:Uncharacterized protein n=1 Tax=Penicillium brasilianum TaxID=104259 RepID=A0A1S9RVH5_PENBI|nr:hypothetical protein PEBR_07820 [Penicillium brasilianum]
MEARILLSHEDYTVGWICALPLEMAAAKLMLDAVHPSLPRPPNDQNIYILGNVGKHNVVIAGLPSGVYGNTSATSVGMQLLSSFPTVRIGLMVGIAGGVPSNDADIRLGDIVVSQPSGTLGGVVQYDLGKLLSDGRFTRTGMLNRPPKVLLTALATLQAHHLTEESRVVEFISNIQAKIPPRKATTFARPTQEDCLFQVQCDHVVSSTYLNCDRSKMSPRPPRDHQELVVHYGLVGSANQVVKDGRQRDQLAKDLGIYCVEMEAAGLMNDFPCLVVRGICDYADSHKNKEWQGYAAAVAAAYAKELLLVIPYDKIHSAPTTHTLPGSEGNWRWLVIFDNIDQYSPVNRVTGDAYDIAEFFPTTDHGSVLVTSRLQGLTELGKSFQLNKLDSNDAIQLLLQSTSLLARDTVGGFRSNPDTLALASRLDGLPLVIVIAGAFMRETRTGVTEYLQYYQESWSELQMQSNPQRQYEHGNLLQIWMISYYEIQKRDPHAAKLLLFLAHFDNRDIWYDLIKSSHNSSEVPVWLERSILSGLTFRTSVRNLLNFSLLETNQQVGSYSIHPVVQDWCIHLSNTDKNADSIQRNELALISVGHSVLSSHDRNCSELQQRLIPHVNHVRHLDWLSGDIDIAAWNAFNGLGNLYSDQGKLKEAEEMYQRALAGKEKALGPDHTSTLGTVNNLGLLYSNQGKLKEAEEMYQRALAGKEKALGPDHTSTLDTVHNLGGLYKGQGKLKEAEEMYQRALAGCEKALGPDHTSTLTTVNNLGNLYADQGKLKEAEEMYQRALVRREKALGPDHMSTLGTVNNLGLLYSDQGS